MIDKTLMEKMLDAPLIIHGFVNDEPKCNYERYMTELLNCSALFMNKTGGEKFCWNEKQDHGECDATTSSYSIDYKLLATKSSLQAKRETSGSITKMADGCIAFGIGRLPEGEKFTYIRTAAALREYSLEGLEKISADSKDNVEKNVYVILKNIKTKKNLLLFYPYIMSFSEPHTFKDGCKSIEDAFNEDLNQIRLYRERNVPGFETYICTIYENKLLIFENDGKHWVLRDSIDMMSSKIYKDLYYSYGNNGFNY